MTGQPVLQEIVYADGSRSLWLSVGRMRAAVKELWRDERKIVAIRDVHGNDVTNKFLCAEARRRFVQGAD